MDLVLLEDVLLERLTHNPVFVVPAKERRTRFAGPEEVGTALEFCGGVQTVGGYILFYNLTMVSVSKAIEREERRMDSYNHGV